MLSAYTHLSGIGLAGLGKELHNGLSQAGQTVSKGIRALERASEATYTIELPTVTISAPLWLTMTSLSWLRGYSAPRNGVGKKISWIASSPKKTHCAPPEPCLRQVCSCLDLCLRLQVVTATPP